VRLCRWETFLVSLKEHSEDIILQTDHTADMITNHIQITILSKLWASYNLHNQLQEALLVTLMVV